MSDLVGTLLGPYRILSRLGQGGMGTVYKAFRPGLERLVAIKVLSQAWEADPSFVERFRQETRLITQLEHRAIVPVYDVGEHEHHLYLVMRYLQAGTARDMLRIQNGPLSVADAAQIVTAVAHALDYAHTHSIIHRDVKPSNILIDKQGHAYLTDFGMAKAILTSTEITRTGDSVGTPAYMAPEQAMGRAVTPETDVYALGVTLYEMVAGQVPFQSDMPIVQAMLHVQSTPPSPRTFNPALSEEVEGVILKALAKNPLDRFHSAGAFASALNAVVVQEAPTQPQRPVLSDLAGAIAADKGAEEITPDLRQELQRRERQERWRSLRRPLIRWGLVGVLLALVLSLLFAGNEIMRGRGAISQTATALVNLMGQLSVAQTSMASGGGNAAEATVQFLQTQIAAGQITLTPTLNTDRDNTETITVMPNMTVTPRPTDTARPTSTLGQAPTPTRTTASAATFTPTPNNSTNATATPSTVPVSDLPTVTLGPSQIPSQTRPPTNTLAPTQTATRTLSPATSTPTFSLTPEPPATATLTSPPTFTAVPPTTPAPTPTFDLICIVPLLCSPTPGP